MNPKLSHQLANFGQKTAKMINKNIQHEVLESILVDLGPESEQRGTPEAKKVPGISTQGLHLEVKIDQQSIKKEGMFD